MTRLVVAFAAGAAGTAVAVLCAVRRQRAPVARWRAAPGVLAHDVYLDQLAAQLGRGEIRRRAVRS